MRSIMEAIHSQIKATRDLRVLGRLVKESSDLMLEVGID